MKNIIKYALIGSACAGTYAVVRVLTSKKIPHKNVDSQQLHSYLPQIQSTQIIDQLQDASEAWSNFKDYDRKTKLRPWFECVEKTLEIYLSLYQRTVNELIHTDPNILDKAIKCRRRLEHCINYIVQKYSYGGDHDQFSQDVDKLRTIIKNYGENIHLEMSTKKP